MIVYDLHCAHGHRFEGWFASSSAYEEQRRAGHVVCATCGSHDVGKAVMAPAVARKGNQTEAAAGPRSPQDVPAAARPLPDPPAAGAAVAAEAAMARFVQQLADAQAKLLASSTWVGRGFAEEARAIHYGESDVRTIHGEISAEEARALGEEGVPCSPLPLPVAPPDRIN